MLNEYRYKIACFIAPDLKTEVHKRAIKLVPKVMKELDGCVFHGSTEYPEAKLTHDEQNQLKVWAKTNTQNPWFRHTLQWIINTQANFALRNAANDRQADFARATINATELLEQAVDRLAGLFDDDRERERAEIFDPYESGIAE